jgi:hypothetical protein
MYVNGVATAPVRETEYQDGWFRTFRKREVPKFTDQEKELLREYLGEGQIEEMLIYMENIRGISSDVSEFAVREFMRGNL